jgi:hypothetical protein
VQLSNTRKTKAQVEKEKYWGARTLKPLHKDHEPEYITNSRGEKVVNPRWSDLNRGWRGIGISSTYG